MWVMHPGSQSKVKDGDGIVPPNVVTDELIHVGLGCPLVEEEQGIFKARQMLV